jgi:hypothetical protein
MEVLRRIYRKTLPKAIREPLRMWMYEREFHPDAEVEFYGAYDHLARHVGESKLGYPLRKRINWQHGWVPDYCHVGSIDPYDATHNLKWSDPYRFNLVARKSEERFLHGLGVANSMAVGLPIVYFPQRRKAGANGALLVMPGHSLDYISQQTFEDEYVSHIDGIRDQFTSVTVCVHPSCKRSGYWIHSFQRSGYRVVTGVEIQDMKSFGRLEEYFSSHEFCTTNKFGSHIMYASLFGCKVSVLGPEPVCSLEDEEKSTIWAGVEDKSPLHRNHQSQFNSVFLSHYPQFAVEHPRAAVQNTELARVECGSDNRMSSRQYREIVEWVTRDQAG